MTNSSVHSLIVDIDYVVANMSLDMQADILDTLNVFIDADLIPSTLRGQIIMAEAASIVWCNLKDTTIRFISPHYYDEYDAEVLFTKTFVGPKQRIVLSNTSQRVHSEFTLDL